ncbi:hypothetical protein Tco_0762308 [Tanacetum coccineum]
METNDTLSSCSDLDEQEIQQLQKQAKILKENSLNKLNALQTTIQHLSSSNHSMYYEFRDAFHRLFEADERTFKDVLSRNMQNLERQLNKETLHEKDSNSGLSMIKVQFDNFIHSRVLELSNSNSHALEITQDFKAYTNMEAQTFKETIIQNMNSIEQCIIERASPEQKLQNGLKRLNERKLQIQECTIQNASDDSSGNTYCSRIVSDNGNVQALLGMIWTSYLPMTQKAEYNVFSVDTQHSEQPESISNTCVVEKGDSNVIPDSPDMCDNDIQNDQNVVECDDERVALANLIANLKLDVDENKKIQKQLKKANASLTQELTECKSILAETSRTLGESNSIRDSCLVALQNKQTELEKYMAFNDRTVDYEKLEHKLNETLGLLAQKDIDIKEGLKLKAYKILVVQEKHDELVKQSLLTKSHYEGLVKEKTKVITDLKLKKEKDIDKKKFNGKTNNDSFVFVHELKKEMHADLKYVESLENEIDKLESDKAEFSNIYDMLLQECVSNDVMCSYLHSLSDLDEITELQCLYLHKVKECECLAQKLSKQTEFVSKEVYTELLQSFAKLEKHSISLELALQQCQEQMKNDIVCKEKASNVFQKEREQYFEIQDLKAQLQDKNIAICSNDMVHNYYLEEAKKKAQLQNDKTLNTKPRVQQSARSPNTANEKKSESRNHGRQIPIGQRFTPNKSSNVYLKTTTPRSGLTWKPMGRIFTQVGLKWIPIRKSVETRYNTNDSASPLGKETHNPKNVIFANSSSLSAGTSMASKPISLRVLLM